MPRQHVHDGRLPLRSRPAACGHFIQIKADDLRVTQIKARGFFQHGIGGDGVENRTPGLTPGFFFIGIEDALILVDLCGEVAQQRHGIALCLNGFMHKTAFKESVYHLPPGGHGVQHDVFAHQQFMEFRQHIGLVQSWLMLVRQLLIGQFNGPAYQPRHILVRWRIFQRSTQQGQQVDQKGHVRWQRLAAAQRRIKRIDGEVFGHAQPVIGCQVLFAFRQILLNKRD